MHELIISKDSSRKKYKIILKALEDSGGRIVDPSDYEQLDSYSDQLYIDYDFSGKLITLHLEHYLGIFLLSENVDVVQLQEIWNLVQKSLNYKAGVK